MKLTASLIRLISLHSALTQTQLLKSALTVNLNNNLSMELTHPAKISSSPSVTCFCQNYHTFYLQHHRRIVHFLHNRNAGPLQHLH